jgi:IMP dehydrogenase
MKPLMSDLPLALSYDDVLLVPAASDIISRSEVDISTRLTPKLSLKIPIISSNMDTVTGIDMAIALGKMGGLGVLPRFNKISEQAEMVVAVKQKNLPVAAAVGVKPGFMDRVSALVEADVDLLVVDVAHGHLQIVADTIKTIKNSFPNLEVAAGNVATAEAANHLFTAGADCVKVGIGPGNACTTRIMTGFGVPQITAVMEASAAAIKHGKTLICDGGTKNSGDIIKGLAAGAHAVMIGSQLAGTDEAPGEVIEQDGKKFKRYSGSTSLEEKRKQLAKMGQYTDTTQIENVEGTSILVPYSGSLSVLINRFLDGIRSGFSYAGAINMTEFHTKAKFIRISPQAWNESAYRFL